jgi:hypothetical protein
MVFENGAPQFKSLFSFKESENAPTAFADRAALLKTLGFEQGEIDAALAAAAASTSS